MFKEIVLPVTLWVFIVIAVTFALTGFWVWDFASDCAEQGGTFLNEGGTVYCTY